MDALSSESDSTGREQSEHGKRHGHAHGGHHGAAEAPDTVAKLQEPHRVGRGLSEMATSPVSPELAIRAIRASGTLVEVTPKDFATIVSLVDKPLVVTARGGLLRRRFSYLVSYRGLTFTTRSRERLQLPEGTDVITAQRVWLPD